MVTIGVRRLLVGVIGVLAVLSCARAQQEPHQPVLTYVRGSKKVKAQVTFVPPVPNSHRARTFRLRTPQGTVWVRCDVPHTANPPRAWASEISYPLTEYLFHFHGPASLPIYLPYRGYDGYGGYLPHTVHEVRVNGKTQPNEDKTRCAPIVINGARNTLSIIICDSGGE